MARTMLAMLEETGRCRVLLDTAFGQCRRTRAASSL